jgi:hypothetical protein
MNARAPMVAVLIVLVAAVGAIAEDDVSQTPPSPAPYHRVETPDPGNRVVCKREKTTGTMIPRRVCRTQREMETTRKMSQQMYRDILSTTRRPPPGETLGGG